MSDEQDKKWPNELWTESGGDPERYRALMIEHGHLIDRTDNPPEPHLFEGMTASCFCTVCGGKFRASWHMKALMDAIEAEAEGQEETNEPFSE